MPAEDVDAVPADATGGRRAGLMRSPHVLVRRAGDQVLILERRSGELVTLAGTAVAAWDLLEDKQTIASLSAELAGRFEVDEAVVHMDIEPLVAGLVARGILVER